MTLEQRIEGLLAILFKKPWTTTEVSTYARTLAAAVREEAIEECAKVCDGYFEDSDDPWSDASAHLATALRALKERKI